MEKKVSVIVPVYNAQNYLKQCLDSLINQTLKEIEIICINDGSSDGSLEILNKFANLDYRIIVINQENNGQSAARNAGLEKARGEYIGFLDSDDFAKSDMFEKLYNNSKMNDSDVSMCSINVFEESTQSIIENDPYFSLQIFPKKFFNKTFNYKMCSDFLFRICVVPWNKLVKRDFLQKNNINFYEGICFEDNIFALELLLKASKISLVKEALPFYRRGSEGSLTYGKNDKAKLDLFCVFEQMEKVLKDNNVYDEYREYFLTHKKNTLLYWYNKIKNQEIKEIYRQNLSELDNFNPFL